MAWIPAAVGAAGSVAGGLLGGGQEQFGPGDAMPNWMEKDWRANGENIKNLQTPEYYQGNTVAGMDPFQTAGINGLGNYGYGQGGNISSAQNFGGNMGVASMGQGLNFLNGLAGQSFPGAGGGSFGFSSGGTSRGAANPFEYDQGTFDQIMTNLQPGMQGAYDSAMRDPTREFNEQTLPGINMASIGDGGQFGTRAFNSGAIASRGLQDRAADTASGIWQNAANQANQGAYGAGINNQNSDTSIQNANTAAGTSRANAITGANVGMANAENSRLNSILGAYGNFAQLGNPFLNSSYNNGMQNATNQINAGNLNQGYNQSLIDADKAKWDYEQQAPWTTQSNLSNLYNSYAMGSAPVQTGSNTMSNMLNGAQAGLGIYGMGQDAGWWGAQPGDAGTVNPSGGFNPNGGFNMGDSANPYGFGYQL